MPNTNPAVAPVDYPPAVLEEAEAAMASALAASRDLPFITGALAGAQAYAAVLARHTVAARMAAEPSRAPFSTSSDPGQFAAELARLATAEPAAGPAILTFDDKTAGRFIVQPSGDGPRVYSFGTTPEQVRPETGEIARLTAERDRALGQLETARMQASAVMTGAEAQTATIERMIAERLTLTAERDALAARHAVLRGTLRGLAICGLEAVQEIAANALAADDKAAQS